MCHFQKAGTLLFSVEKGDSQHMSDAYQIIFPGSSFNDLTQSLVNTRLSKERKSN